ncbi:MAG: AraC family transcriptional regulator [Lutibacter sp.]
MKVIPFTIAKPKDAPYIYQEEFANQLFEKLHKHDEIQISYIAKGEGTCIIGNSLKEFKQGDIIIIGAQLPHIFKFDKQVKPKAKMDSVFFKTTIFNNLNVFNDLTPFIKNANSGFMVKSDKSEIIKLINNFKLAKDSEQFIYFLTLIKKITLARKEFILSNDLNLKISNDLEGKRMQTIFEYTLNHYKNKISLNEIASQANLTPQSFCRYFKQRTNKNYAAFLNEIRIENACKLLLKNLSTSIAEISVICGFRNLAHFNRTFKKVKKTTPSAYRFALSQS